MREKLEEKIGKNTETNRNTHMETTNEKMGKYGSNEENIGK